jgi:FAD/FMN-containing dehydrogenase
VTLARESKVELAVRSGGHSNAGHSSTDGGIVLDLSAMNALDIDVAGGTAWAQTSLTAGELTTAAAQHGLAVGFGDTGSVGIGGITLGGGIGYLVRKHGLTIDNLLAAELVTADGQLVHTDAETLPELFWAIRGGGGNFGVATRLRFRLHRVATVVGGMLMLPATPEVLAGFIAEAEAAPEQLSAIANVMPAPPLPLVPAEHHGRLVVMALLCFAGDPEAGQRTIAPFRALATLTGALVPVGPDRALAVSTEAEDTVRIIPNPYDQGKAWAVIVERLTAATALDPEADDPFHQRVRRLLAEVLAGERWLDALESLAKLDPAALTAVDRELHG